MPEQTGVMMNDAMAVRRLADRARQLGATEARIIDPASIITAPWVRLKCQYGCGAYGSNLCCPPHSPTPDETRRILACYQRALLVHCRPGASPGEIIVTLEREAFLSGFYRAFGMGSGPCRLCDECPLDRCIHPREARPSMEACGIDVYATVRGNDLPIEVVRDRTSDRNHYGVLLLD